MNNVTTVADKLLYDRKSAAYALSISTRSLDYLIAAKKFNTRRIGKKILIPHGELVRFARADHFGSVTGNQAA
jgi:hypothetical protein